MYSRGLCTPVEIEVVTVNVTVVLVFIKLEITGALFLGVIKIVSTQSGVNLYALKKDEFVASVYAVAKVTVCVEPLVNPVIV